MDELSEFEIRKHICEVIAQNPGIHLSKIAERLQLKIPVVQHYLAILEQQGRISFLDSDGFKRYYFEEKQSGIRDKRIRETRKKIYSLISNSPGLHLSKIAELLHMQLSLAEYHLTSMEKDRLIIAVKDVGYYKRYYLTGSDIGVEQRKMVSLLREEIPLKIVLFLLKQKSAKHKDILQNFDITSSTLSYHLNKLVNLGIVAVPSLADNTGYQLKNPEKIIELLKKYRLIPLTKSFTDIWDDLKFK
jgi:predicted transcriptional regulator